MATRARRVLFALAEPGYFRFYGSTITELARRGWDVSLAYPNPGKRGPGVTVPASAGERVHSLGRLPGGSSPGAKALRITLDYVRYLEPAFSRAAYLRRRVEKRLPPPFGFLKRINVVPRSVVSGAIRLGRIVERMLPINADVLDFVRSVRPDVVVVSPLVAVGRTGAHETEVVKAARALHVPTIVGVASWDHLTSKGLIRVVPDAVMVWNDVQVEEAHYLHRIPRTRIVTTGAQSFDRWFDRPKPDSIEVFRRSLGIEDGRRVLLCVGSSPNMAPGDSEVRFVRKWLAALRASSHREVRDAFVIVRPHPGHVEPWQDADLGDPHAIVHPKTYAARVLLTDNEVETFWYSLLASSAVIGVNTTAMIEAAIVRRPVLSVRDAAFAHSQQQTLHFDYLSSARGGFTIVSEDLAAHVREVERLFSGEPDLRAADAFVARFVRPLGMTTRATTHVCDTIERVAGAHHAQPLRADAMTTGPSSAVSPHS